MRTRLLFFLLISMRTMHAGPQLPIAFYFTESDKVLLTHVTAADQKSVTFELAKALKGTSDPTFILHNRFGHFHTGSEYLILSCPTWRTGSYGKAIGSFMFGSIGWIYAPAKYVDSQTYVYSPLYENDHEVYDKEIDGLKYLSLPHIESLLAHPPKL